MLSCGLLSQLWIVCVRPEMQWLQTAVTQKKAALPSCEALVRDRYTWSTEGELCNGIFQLSYFIEVQMVVLTKKFLVILSSMRTVFSRSRPSEILPSRLNP